MFCSNVEKSFDSRNNNPTLSHLNIHCWASSIKNTYLEILLVNLVSACIICDTGIFDCSCVRVCVCVCVNATVCLRPTVSVYVYTWKKVSSTSYTFWIWYNLDGACMLGSHCFIVVCIFMCVCRLFDFEFLALAWDNKNGHCTHLNVSFLISKLSVAIAISGHALT